MCEVCGGTVQITLTIDKRNVFLVKMSQLQYSLCCQTFYEYIQGNIVNYRDVFLTQFTLLISARYIASNLQ